MGYNSVSAITGISSFVQPLLPSEVAKSRKNPIKFDFTAVQDRPGLLSLVCFENQYVTSSYSLIETLAVSAVVLEMFAVKVRKELIDPPLCCLTFTTG